MGHSPMVPTFFLAVPHPKPAIGMKVHENRTLTKYYDWGQVLHSKLKSQFLFIKVFPDLFKNQRGKFFLHSKQKGANYGAQHQRGYCLRKLQFSEV